MKYCFFRLSILLLTYTTVLLSSCSPIYREEYTTTTNNRMQILAKMYNAKISPLAPDSILKYSFKKKLSKKEVESGEEALLKLERYLATLPDSLITYVNLQYTTPNEVTRVDSVYFNINKWNYLKENGLITKNTYFIKRESR